MIDPAHSNAPMARPGTTHPNPHAYFVVSPRPTRPCSHWSNDHGLRPRAGTGGTAVFVPGLPGTEGARRAHAHQWCVAGADEGAASTRPEGLAPTDVARSGIGFRPTYGDPSSRKPGQRRV